MAEFFASGRVVDVILGLVLLEAAALLALRRLTGRGPDPWQTIAFLLAGACLLLALRAALVDAAAWHRIAVWLMAGLLAHLADLLLRWRRPGGR
jgi:hypothetical protein